MKVHRIEVGLKQDLRDNHAQRILKKLKRDLSLHLENLHYLRVYLVEGDFTEDLLKVFAESALTDPVIETYALDEPLSKRLGFIFDWALEIGLRPGVTDNEGKTAEEALSYILERPLDAEKEGVYFARLLLLKGALSQRRCGKIARDLLAK